MWLRHLVAAQAAPSLAHRDPCFTRFRRFRPHPPTRTQLLQLQLPRMIPQFFLLGSHFPKVARITLLVLSSYTFASMVILNTKATAVPNDIFCRFRDAEHVDAATVSDRQPGRAG